MNSTNRNIHVLIVGALLLFTGTAHSMEPLLQSCNSTLKICAGAAACVGVVRSGCSAVQVAWPYVQEYGPLHAVHAGLLGYIGYKGVSNLFGWGRRVEQKIDAANAKLDEQGRQLTSANMGIAEIKATQANHGEQLGTLQTTQDKTFRGVARLEGSAAALAVHLQRACENTKNLDCRFKVFSDEYGRNHAALMAVLNDERVERRAGEERLMNQVGEVNGRVRALQVTLNEERQARVKAERANAEAHKKTQQQLALVLSRLVAVQKALETQQGAQASDEMFFSLPSSASSSRSTSPLVSPMGSPRPGLPGSSGAKALAYKGEGH